MYSDIVFRTGDEKSLLSEFSQRIPKFKVANLDPYVLMADNVLAVHCADRGAQGDPGAIRILYRSWEGVQVLYGNYAYKYLNLGAVVQRLPMLGFLEDRRDSASSYPFGRKIYIPAGWGYVYIGAMNHFFARKAIHDKTKAFVDALLDIGGCYSSLVFDAVAWLCMAQEVS